MAQSDFKHFNYCLLGNKSIITYFKIQDFYVELKNQKNEIFKIAIFSNQLIHILFCQKRFFLGFIEHSDQLIDGNTVDIYKTYEINVS